MRHDRNNTPRPFRIGAIATTYHHTNPESASHAEVIISRWFTPRDADRDWGWPGPRSEIASLYLDQRQPENDNGVALCKTHGLHLSDTIEEALTLGGDSLAVDAVMIIGEHGEYPHNDLGQKLYPRKEFFDAVVATFEKYGNVVPVFTDKHLSWNFDAGRQMVETARRLDIPLLAGSSLSHVARLTPPPSLHGIQPDEAVAIFFGGNEVYGFHSLEFVQAIIEARGAGETGIRRVTAHQGDEVWRAMDSGAWSRELMEAAIAAPRKPYVGDYRENCRNQKESPAAFIVEYLDGLRVTHVNMDGHVRGWGLALRLPGDPTPHATAPATGGQETFFAHFATFARVIEDTLLTGRAPFPVERTLLTTGATEAFMHALAQPGQPIDTPHLAIPYAPQAHTSDQA